LAGLNCNDSPVKRTSSQACALVAQEISLTSPVTSKSQIESNAQHLKSLTVKSAAAKLESQTIQNF